MRRSISATREQETTRLLPNRVRLEEKSYTFGGELGYLASTSMPVSLSYALQNSLQTCSVLVAGRLGPDELSTAAFSYMLAMVTGWCVALGGTTAMDTLASSTFSGKSPKTDVGILLQRCFVGLGILYIPAGLLWWFVAPVLRLLGQSDQLAIDTQLFLRVLSVGAPGYIAFESVKKFLQCQGIMHASTMVLLITSPFNILLNYLLVHKTSLGVLGAPLATSITYWLSFSLLCAYSRFVRGSECWGGWDRRCLQRLTEFLKLAVPGILHVGTEWWAFEIVALAAGRLGALPLAAQSVIMTVDQVLNTLPFGIGVAASSRLGNLLGARKAGHARLSSHAAVSFATAIGILVLVVLMTTRSQFGSLFSDNEDVVKLVAAVLPYVAAFQIADGWAQSTGGVLRGMGKQHVGAAVNLIAYYLLALPTGIWLAFNTNLGLAGLWIGQCGALFLVGIGQYILLLFTDWKLEVRRSEARLETEQGDDSEETRSRSRDVAVAPYQSC